MEDGLILVCLEIFFSLECKSFCNWIWFWSKYMQFGARWFVCKCILELYVFWTFLNVLKSKLEMYLCKVNGCSDVVDWVALGLQMYLRLRPNSKKYEETQIKKYKESSDDMKKVENRWRRLRKVEHCDWIAVRKDTNVLRIRCNWWEVDCKLWITAGSQILKVALILGKNFQSIWSY